MKKRENEKIGCLYLSIAYILHCYANPTSKKMYNLILAHEPNLQVCDRHSTALTLYDPGGGGGFKSPPLLFFALTHLILELHYCALVTFPKK